ncbi:SDR family oxidoreductase [Brevibacillus sp. B_LB10_24]|uniref:SDR family oxidoreductase n=1 Tax=Brevibacillus sp. B_LB10_24 TaxID=3380645 RepID=UPI0038BC1E69
MNRNTNGSRRPVALVTGSSSGFGLLSCIELAKEGYDVIATMRDVDKQGELIAAAANAGVSPFVRCLAMDVTDFAQVEAVIQDVQSEYDGIDVLVNNAGFAVGGFVEDIPLAEWQRQMDTNFFGVVAVTKAVLPAMREQRSGRIINIGSVSGKIGFPGYGPYAASKFAVAGFSEALRLEMLPFGIQVVLIEPGSYKTPIWQKGFASILTKPDSPYAAQMEAVLRYSRRSAETAPNPIEVARAVVNAAKKRRPKLRYTMGQGALLAAFAKTVLPWKWFETIIRRNL